MSTDEPGAWPPPDPSGRQGAEEGAPAFPGGPDTPDGAATRPLPAPAVAVPPPADGPADAPSASEPASPRGNRNPFGLTALIVGVVALVLAVIPFASFAAGLPALAAIVFGIVGLVVRDRPRGTAIAGLIIGTVALIVAIVVSAILVANLVTGAVRNIRVSDFPSAFPSEQVPSAATGDLAPGPHTITYRVTGSGAAGIVYSTIADRHSGFARDLRAALPRTRRQHVTIIRGGGEAAFLVTGVEVNGSQPLACSIAVDGRTVAQRTSKASSGFESVTCAYRAGG